jgi:galactofuranosylgalactofuranosylrhamnosyl-N-acetylglucosaminyl-diphospho-decaprenol beta-1,5/1,6-galactofuranosyltransferase
MTVLQSLVLPNLDVPSSDDMSVRIDNRRAWVRLAEHRVEFAHHGQLAADTFYNGFSVGAWRRVCDIDALTLALRGQGRFVLRLGLHRKRQAAVWLAEHEIVLREGQTHALPVAAWPALRDGLLFWTVRALEPGHIDGADWLAPEAPAREVNLAIVITHFNRQAQVRPAIARIRRALAAREDLREHVSLTVVDNSRNLGLASHDGVQVIESRNLGGTGGFVRGLLAAIDAGRATHVLFMDDDASCETEAIARTWALLSHARDARQAVCGALLREAAPWHLLEKGARFEREVKPLHQGLDLRRTEDLLAADGDGTVSPDYGAWWFFAFPLHEVKAFPFPFFVRGDDIQFGLANRFRIATLNGVACLGEDFGVKHSPLTAYLDARYHLVLALVVDNGRPLRQLRWVAGRLFVKSLCAYQYSSARAVTLALRHVLEGPEFFRTQIDLQAVRSEIASWQPDEKLRPIDRDALGTLRPDRKRREGAARRLARLLTLQGFLLPNALIKNRTIVQDKNFHGRASAAFRYRRVLYEHPAGDTGFVAHFDRARFFGELRAFIGVAGHMLWRLEALRAAFRDAAQRFGQRAFWEDVHGVPAAAAPPAAGARSTPLPTELGQRASERRLVDST